MAYNGSGTFNITTAGQPVITGTVISSTAFNALTADLATGLSTAITKDGQTTTTARILFAQGVSSTLVTDATSATTGSIITAGGISMQKALWVGTTSRHVGATQFDAAITYGGVTLSNAVTGTGNMVLSASPTLTGTLTGAAANFSGILGIGITPSAWSTFNAAQVGLLSMASYTNGDTDISSNLYYNAGWKYIGTGRSAQIQLDSSTGGGNIVFTTDATGGTAGGASSATEKMRITAAGLVGIGMTPSNVLDITKTQNAASLIKILNTNASGSALVGFQSQNASHTADFQMLGTGYTPAGMLLADMLYLHTDGAGGMAIISESGGIKFGTGGYSYTEAARIGTDGSFLVGMTGNQGAGVIAASTRVAIGNNGTTGATTPSLYAFQNVGAASTQEIITVANGVSGGTVSCRILASGNIQNTNNSYGAISDIAFKENITDATPKLAALMNVKIRNFNMKHNIELKQIGVIAQELETVFPNLVEQSEDGVKSVKYSVFVPILIKAVQELTTRLAALENK